MKKTDLIFIFLLFYAGWFGCVFLGRTPYSLVSFLFPILLIGFLKMKGQLRANEIYASLGLAAVGVIFDAWIIQLGLVTTSGDSIFRMPFWLISIWLLFAFSMIKLGRNFQIPIWLSALLGFVMGPLTYKSGEVFQVLKLEAASTLWIYAIFWAVLFPNVLFLSKRLR